VSDVENVMVDIGTGYFVKKPIAQALEYVERKQKVLADNLQQVR